MKYTVQQLLQERHLNREHPHKRFALWVALLMLNRTLNSLPVTLNCHHLEA
jgi:hypothetical protein